MLPETIDVIPVDCRDLFEPTEAGQRLHRGTHPATFGAIATHPKLANVLQAASRDLATRMTTVQRMNTSQIVCYAFMCKSGRHRSVACARICSEIASTNRFLRGGDTSDLTPSSRTSMHCQDCQFCDWFTTQWDTRNKALRVACDVWTRCWQPR
jgi:hypothetical protein